MRLAAGLILTLVLAGGALANETNAPQRGAVREACKNDVATLCAGIQPGEGRIKACLRENKDKLSEGCRSAIATMMQARRAARDAQKQTPPAQGSAPAASP